MKGMVNNMGINRVSIYDTFGDKHSLFLEALDRYREIQSRKVFEELERPGSMKKHLRRLFEETVAGALSAEARLVCFVHHSMSALTRPPHQTHPSTPYRISPPPHPTPP